MNVMYQRECERGSSVKRIDMVPKSFFETVGERETTYRIYGHAMGKEPMLFLKYIIH